ncbi:MAG: hypothetical protein K2F63_03990, partial [Muribaculaceae bacterium]|nr:hypothetical protein [Muribaculaceae bacterium]
NNVDATTIVRATPRPGYKVSKLTAVIIDNEWRPHDNGSGFVEEYNTEAWNWSVNGEQRYGENIKRTDLDDSESARNVCFGFLSLRNPGTTERIDFGGAAALNSNGVDNLIKGIRDNFYKSNIHGGKSLGKREYTQIPQDVTGDNGQTYDEGDNGNYSVLVKKAWLENGLETKDYIFTIPVYTRPKTLDSWGVFSGCNQNTNNYRYARVKYIAEYEPLPGVVGEKYSDTSYANCYQSQRIDNPVGVYRNYDNTDAFNITMMYAQGAGFQAVESRGPWSVTIETDPDGLVELSYRGKTVSGQGASLTGQTGTNVTFSYKPRGTVGIEGSRGAVLRVLYHNYSCYHLIVVRQGYAPVDLHESTRWSSFNLFDSETLC